MGCFFAIIGFIVVGVLMMILEQRWKTDIFVVGGVIGGIAATILYYMYKLINWGIKEHKKSKIEEERIAEDLKKKQKEKQKEIDDEKARQEAAVQKAESEVRKQCANNFKRKSNIVTMQCQLNLDSIEQLSPVYEGVSLQDKLWNAFNDASTPAQKLTGIVSEITTRKESN